MVIANTSPITTTTVLSSSLSLVVSLSLSSESCDDLKTSYCKDQDSVDSCPALLLTDNTSLYLMSGIIDFRKAAARQIKLLTRAINRTRKLFNECPEGPLREQFGMKTCDIEAKLLNINCIGLFMENFDSGYDAEKMGRLASSVGLRTEEPPGKSKKKNRRLPYHVYTSSDGIEILVGRSASENDQLSTNPMHRHDDQWWLHAAEYSGAHVVICSSDDNLQNTCPQTIIEAALLAVSHSSCKEAACSVDLTRCRDVHKDSGDPDGLVRLRAVVRTLHVNLDISRDQLASLQSTKNKLLVSLT